LSFTQLSQLSSNENRISDKENYEYYNTNEEVDIEKFYDNFYN